MEGLMTLDKSIDKKLLVIGGTGFIGYWTVLNAIKCGYKVTVLARRAPKFQQKIINVEYFEVDISIYEDVLKAIGSKFFTHVINLSGEINHSNFKEGGKSIIENHFFGLLNIVNALNQDYLKCFIQIGTSDEYGNAAAPQQENNSSEPLSSYSFAKLSSNNFLQMLSKVEKFPVVIIRLFLVYGPNQNNQRFLPQVISACISNKSFPVSEGNQLRDFCFVNDVVDGIFLAIESEGFFGQIFNIASGNPISIKSMVQKVVRLVGKGRPIFGSLPYRENENMELYADVSKAKKLLNWKPTSDLNHSLQRTIKYYQNDY